MVVLVFGAKSRMDTVGKKGAGDGGWEEWLSITLCRSGVAGQEDTGKVASGTHGCFLEIYPRPCSVERLTDD